MGVGSAPRGKLRRCYQDVIADPVMGEESYVPVDDAVLTTKTEPL